MADALVARVEAICGPVAVATTAAPGDAARLACSAAEQGVARILIAGGDGTTGEVVTGLLSARRLERPAERASASSRPDPKGPPSLGLLPVGSGCDLARSLGLPRRLDAALEVIAAGHLRPLDAGRVELLDRNGGHQVRYFANELSAGLSGDTVNRVGGLSQTLGPRLGFLLGALSAVLTHQPFEASLEIDGERVYEGPISLLAVANGCYFGAGMRVAPGAAVDDGVFEVVLARALPRREIFAWLPAFYLGLHGRNPRVSFHAARSVALIPTAGEPAVEVDGEGGFTLPLRITCLPGALRVHTPAATIPVMRSRPVQLARIAPRVVAPLALRREWD